MKVILSGHIEVPLEELTTVEKALPVHVALTLQEPGCLIFEVEEDAEVPGLFRVYEEFVNQEAFDYHQERASKSEWAKATVNVKRKYQLK